MVGGERLTFGFHGIYQGTAVLYDHQTGSLWIHLTGECFAGKLRGTRLRRLPTGRHTTWMDWEVLHPDTTVMRYDPALAPAPGRPGYFPRSSARAGLGYFPPEFPATIRDRDPRLAESALLYGVVVGGRARAYPYARLRRRPVVEETLGGVPITVWFDPAARSAAAYRRRLGQRLLSFVPKGGAAFEDRETESRWNTDGECVAGPLRGSRLVPLFGLQAEWYGWYANHPETTVFGP